MKKKIKTLSAHCLLKIELEKGCSKFWISNTFKHFLYCGTNSIFKKQWADNVLKIFIDR